MNNEEITKLVEAGYKPSFDNKEFFKVKGIIEKKKYIYTAIFINLNKEITFDGYDNYKQELLTEVKSLIGGLKC